MKQTLGLCFRKSYETSEINGMKQMKFDAMKQLKLFFQKPNVAFHSAAPTLILYLIVKVQLF